MPRPKGSKNKAAPPVAKAVAASINCPKCGKILPGHALSGVMGQLRALIVEFDRVPPPDLELLELRRFARLQLLTTRSIVQLLIEDEEMFCLGHAPEKRGPRPKKAFAEHPAFPEPEGHLRRVPS